MKKLIISLLCLTVIFPIIVACDDRPIPFVQLPQQAQQFVKEHFADNSVALVKKDVELNETSYELIFTSGSRVQFDRKGNWTDVECKYTQFPMEIIPQPIRNYLSQNYPEIKVCKIEKKSRKRYEVELINDIELMFDSNYNLIGIDY